MKTKLWAHQQRIVEEFVKKKKLLVIAGLSTGKTLAAYGCIEAVQAKKVLIICPKSVITGWYDNAVEHLEYNVTPLIKGSVAKKSSLIKENGIYITNYETAWRIPKIGSYNWDMVVCDESHKLKSYSSKVSNVLADAFRNVPYKLLLTGTPYADSPLDVYGQIRFLTPALKAKRYVTCETLGSYNSFFDAYTVYYNYGNIKIPTGYKNLEGLAANIKNLVLHVTKTDLKLPNVIHTEHKLVLEGELAKHYINLENDLITYVKDEAATINNILNKTLRLQMLLCGVVKLDNDSYVYYDNPKLNIIKDLAPSEPYVIFTNFKYEVESLLKEYPDACVLDGARNDLVAWQKGNQPILIANCAAGGAGVELHKARYAFYMSHPLSRSVYEQSLGRIRRVKSTTDTVFYIHLTGYIESAIMRALNKKGELANILTGELKNAYLHL